MEPYEGLRGPYDRWLIPRTRDCGAAWTLWWRYRCLTAQVDDLPEAARPVANSELRRLKQLLQAIKQDDMNTNMEHLQKMD